MTELEADRDQISQQVAAMLNETDKVPLQQIAGIVEQCGAEFAMKAAQEALDLEANGGMMLKDNSRRRTVGGIFFFLVRGRMTKEQHRVVFGVTRVYPGKKKKKGKGKKSGNKDEKQAKASAEPARPEFIWEERASIVGVLADARGVATTVKVTLIGRPGNVELRKDLAIIAMDHTLTVQAMPKGVPKAPPTATTYVIYIGMKQWTKVEPALANPEDALIIEGVTGFDPEVGTMAVYASNVTTKVLQRQKREPQGGGAPAGEKPPKPPAAPKAAPNAPKAPAKPEYPIPANATPEVVGKLRELHAAASALRQKLSGLQSNPSTQQFILTTTQKSLKNIEDQIAVLEQQYS